MEFRTKIESGDVSIYNLNFPKLKGLENGSDYEIEPCPFTVSWNFEIEAREWGVKDLSWYVTGIEGQFEIVYLDEKGDEKERELIDFEFEYFREKAEMDIALEDRSICPQRIEIHYSDMSIEVV